MKWYTEDEHKVVLRQFEDDVDAAAKRAGVCYVLGAACPVRTDANQKLLVTSTMVNGPQATRASLWLLLLKSVSPRAIVELGFSHDLEELKDKATAANLLRFREPAFVARLRLTLVDEAPYGSGLILKLDAADDNSLYIANTPIGFVVNASQAFRFSSEEACRKCAEDFCPDIETTIDAAQPVVPGLDVHSMFSADRP